MTARSALFRLFLATILMLNGIASAMAAVQHAARPGVPGENSEAAQVDPAAAGEAHDGCEETDPVLADNDSAIYGATQGPGDLPGADCCEPGTCQGTCANAGVPALPAAVYNGFATPGHTCSRPPASWHAAPALPHLMRPPIS